AAGRGLGGRPITPELLSTRLIHERDLIRATLRRRVGLVVFYALAQPLTDYGALLLSLRAAGAHVSAAASMAAFVVSNIAGLVPLTPGGLGFVEAGLAHILTFAAATRSHAPFPLPPPRPAP